MDIRHANGGLIEVRQEGDSTVISGPALTYGDTTTLVGGIEERFLAGALYPDAIVVANAFHDRTRPLTHQTHPTPVSYTHLTLPTKRIV